MDELIKNDRLRRILLDLNRIENSFFDGRRFVSQPCNCERSRDLVQYQSVSGGRELVNQQAGKPKSYDSIRRNHV